MTELYTLLPSGYARCPGCDQTKHVDVDGAMRVHNKYVPLRASSLIGRCSGSGQRPAGSES